MPQAVPVKVFNTGFVSDFVQYRQSCPGQSCPGKVRGRRSCGERAGAALVVLCALVAILAGCLPGVIGAAQAQENASQEAGRRRAALDRLPEDAAQRLFGLTASPAPAPGRAIGSYTRGCLAGGVALPPDGANWQVMRPSRNRAWGHPALIEFIQRLAVTAHGAGWPGLLVGDIAQPRGGPMLTGHASHQLGIEADLWLTPMPDRRLSAAERDDMPATNLVAANGDDVDPAAWRSQHRKLLEAAARSPGVARIFVNAAIKRALCREAAGERDREWLRRIRPSWGHNFHFHVRLYCPRGESECQNQPDPGPGDGCAELAWWFTDEAKHPKPGPPRKPLRVADLPPACAALVSR